MHLLYITFGNNNRNHTQAYFSIYSFLAQKIPCASINLITDRPSYYQSIKNILNIIEVDEATLEEWKGPFKYLWRIKIKGIQTISKVYNGEPVLYLDTDTFFYRDDFNFLNSKNKAAMFENEGPLKTLRSKTMKTMSSQLKNIEILGLKHFPNWDMWNAGVVFIPNNLNGHEMEFALAICDEMCRCKVKDKFVEQFAISVALYHLHGLQANKHTLAHYWSNKEEWNEIIKTFLLEGKMFDLSFEEEIERFRNFEFYKYPVVRLSKTTNKRLKKKIDQVFSDKKIEYLSPPKQEK